MSIRRRMQAVIRAYPGIIEVQEHWNNLYGRNVVWYRPAVRPTPNCQELNTVSRTPSD